MLEKFRITHGWKDSHKENRWNIALDGYDIVWTENEESYNQALKDGYIEIDIGEEYSTETVL